MDMTNLALQLKEDRQVRTGLEECTGLVSFELLDGLGRSLAICFREMTKLDHSGREKQADTLENVCLELSEAVLNHLDESGIVEAIGKAGSHLKDFSFASNINALYFDHAILTDGLGVPNSKAVHYWHMVDRRKADTVAMMAKSGFKLASLLKKKRKRADDVPEWAHLLRPWVLLGGVALGVGNAAAAIASAGVATPLLIASGVAAGAGIADGILDR
jgi:hypothetical protein